MKRALGSATLLLLVACAGEGGDGYQGSTQNPVVGGQGAAPAVPMGGVGAPPNPGVGVPPTVVQPTPAGGASGGIPTAAGVGGGLTAGASGQGMAGGSAMLGGSGGMTPPRGGMGGGTMGGSGGMGGMMGGNTPGTVTVEFTTVSYGGEYAPLNYGAVWFERAGGTFVKTAKRWAGTTHASDLVAWTMASGGWGSIFGGGNTADMMDAMSSATIRTHQKHTVTWNMMDAQKMLVPDGAYVAVVEMSESRARDRAGPIIRMEFTKGPMPQMVMPANMESFTGIVLRYEP